MNEVAPAPAPRPHLALPAAIGDMELTLASLAAGATTVVMRRRLQWLITLPYAVVALLIGGMVCLSFADPHIAWLRPWAAVVVGAVAAVAVFAVSAYNGLAPRWVTFDFAAKRVRARGYDPFLVAGADIDRIVAAWTPPDPSAAPGSRAARTRVDLLVVSTSEGEIPFADGKAAASPDEANALRGAVDRLLQRLGEGLEVPVEHRAPSGGSAQDAGLGFVQGVSKLLDE